LWPSPSYSDHFIVLVDSDLFALRACCDRPSYNRESLIKSYKLYKVVVSLCVHPTVNFSFTQIVINLIQFSLGIFKLHRMHDEMQTIVTDDRGVCLLVCLSRCSTVYRAFV